ncbi:MAG: M48 family metallopeptidase [Anaerolineae bacterium]|nr:M48 family metallopeptidase [Anaerolineae bacterium]
MQADGPEVRQFIADALAGLPEPEYRPIALGPADVREMVTSWAGRLGVDVTRTQIRAMRTKWGSVSTAGTLTLADDLLRLPDDLIEYVVVHELLHLKFPNHRKGWRVSMGMYVPDWRERERRLQACQLALATGTSEQE